ncbi:hypothetical protein CRU86_06400 [Aliarcobacter skirrowii]|uniref:hypothetical protein n=1 Tax=Aliarcobacter skirrowii TaxID=28200 RepID=UPI00100B1DE0|nr:hypothetical protein [Aliarcobacter skirrowii]RXJ77154.1 hypothetical protein CRU86_06400 [Aliarcobacter skirrowii]
MKNSFALFEFLIALILSSTLLILSSYVYKSVVTFNKNNQELAIKELSLNSLRAFLEKNRESLFELEFKNSNLYFKNELLFLNLDSFSIKKESGFFIINLKTPDNKNIVWYIKEL